MLLEKRRRNVHKIIETNLLYHKSHSSITNDNLKEVHFFFLFEFKNQLYILSIITFII